MSSAGALPPCTDLSDRWSVKAGYWYDDWLIIFPLIIGLGWNISLSPLVDHGFGKHFECASPDGIPFFLKTLFVWEYLYTILLATVKYSIILFYWRVFHVPSFRKYLWVLVFLVTGWAVGVIITSSVTCIPTAAFWGAVKGNCLVLKDTFIGNAVPNIVTDALLLLVPLKYIYQLHTPKSYKVALLVVFICAALVITISIVRLYVTITTSAGPDVTWNDLPEVIWTTAEIHTAIICANLPSFGPILKKFLESSGVWSKGSHPNTSYSGGQSRSSGFKGFDSKNARNEYPMDNFVQLHDDGYKSEPGTLEAGHGTPRRIGSYDDDEGLPLRQPAKRSR
ncbi:MAG: hypothetical protein M1828_003077 [Chrysothrix sp. TS-e1954]|nr:MAG: hypothetical protein M1828_003077 [Chrysothrix sp. TS-e1954]